MSDGLVELQSKNPRVPSREELEMIRDSTLLPMILSIADKNREEIERSSYTFKPLFAKLVVRCMDLVSQDLAKVKRGLKTANIKVIEDDQLGDVMYYRFICRGYEERFGMVREVVRAEMSVRIGQYMKRLFSARDC